LRVLARGFVVQAQVVHALILRETRTRFGAHQLGYLWAFLEPMMWIGSFFAMFTLGQRRVHHGMDVLSFLATGILTYELFSKNVSRIGDAINGNKALLFYPQVQPIDLVWARAALETATLSAIFATIMAVSAFVRGRIPSIDNLPYMFLGLALTALLGISFGLMLCMLGSVSNVVERLRGPLLRPLFWTSGLFFTLDDAPDAAQPYLLYNPVLHAIEMVRDGWFPSYDSPQADPYYVVKFILLFGAVGLLTERVVRRRLELT
jgi:capsular polysaccharide transport system permease protein